MQGRALRRMRFCSNMKQSHLADLLGVDQATISRWERGVSPIPTDAQTGIQRLFAAPCCPAQDTALKRLVESSTLGVHLVCDETHRLLAASPARQVEWRASMADLFGKSLLPYASLEILKVEAKLDGIKWRKSVLSQIVVETGSNAHPEVHIPPGRVLWERVPLTDGSIGRLVTTITR